MNSWNDNKQRGIYNEPCILMTNEKVGKEASTKVWAEKLGHCDLIPNE